MISSPLSENTTSSSIKNFIIDKTKRLISMGRPCDPKKYLSWKNLQQQLTAFSS